MKRNIIEIDESLCNGCGACLPNCAEGALKIVDGKARIISDLFCDGLGACIGHCPLGAIRIVEREAEPYDEWSVMERIVKAGPNLVKEHLQHLKDHGQTEYLVQAHEFLKVYGYDIPMQESVRPAVPLKNQWPIQLHLVNPRSPVFHDVDLLVAADCTAFTARNFQSSYVSGKAMVVACPKLDAGQDTYIKKLVAFLEEGGIRSITVLIMEVPCCGGLVRLVQEALRQAPRSVPLRVQVLSIEGELIKEI